MAEPATSERRLRAAMIVPDFDRTGGYERQAFFLARHNVRSGIDSFILTNNPWGHPPREIRDGVRIHRLDPLPRSRTTWPNLYKAFLLFLTSHRDDYDVIHCHAFTFLAACCVAIGKVLDKPVLVKVATEQDIREFHFGRKIGFRVCYPLLRRADKLLSLSESIRHEFLTCGFREKRVVLMPNGVDAEHFKPASDDERAAHRRALGIGPNDFTFLFTGRLVERKGVDVLLRAIAAHRELRGCRHLILGDGEECGRLEELARKLGIASSVDFAGEHTEVRPYLGVADAFVFPSRLEGLPNALLEAMASGLPSIATRIGGCTDVIENGSGLLVEPDSVAELGAAMARVATDAEARASLAVGARRRITSAFSFDRVCDRLQALYRKTVFEKIC